MATPLVDTMVDRLQELAVQERLLPPLNRIPTELRLKIFGLVLRSDETLVPDGLDPEKRFAEREVQYSLSTLTLGRVDIELLVALANDDKYIEAFEAFYATNTFHFSEVKHIERLKPGSSRVDIPLMHIKHLEMSNSTKITSLLHPKRFPDVLAVGKLCRKLETFVIGYDGLEEMATLRGHLAWMHTTEGVPYQAQLLVCVGVGHYKFRYDDVNVEFKDYALLRSWQAMQSSAPKSFEQLALAFKEPSGQLKARRERMVLTEKMSLAEWVPWFDKYSYYAMRDIDPVTVGGLDDSSRALLTSFAEQLSSLSGSERTRERRRAAVSKVWALMADGMSFRDLNHPGQSADMLEAMGEVVHDNMRIRFPWLTKGGDWYKRAMTAQVLRGEAAAKRAARMGAGDTAEDGIL